MVITVAARTKLEYRHMKAALIREVGAMPEVGEVGEPSGKTINVLAAPINPIDIAVSRGVLATGHPELPYVPGCEAVGRAADGSVVWIFGGSLGRTSQGAIAELAPVGDAHMIPVPDGVDAALAGALGIAGLAGWLPFAWRAPLSGGARVLVLGATGSVGLVAVQAAKLLGAARVVAAGRSAAGLERASRCGADATIRLDEQRDLVTAFKEAFGGEGPSYVFDPLWGEPGAAAVRAAAPRATVVNLGQSAGATAELASADVRFKSLSILGHTNYAVPYEELADHYRRLVGYAVAGEIRVDVERVPLDSVTDAWRRQADAAGTKLVVVP
jgi:NADPH2:quinone reductase